MLMGARVARAVANAAEKRKKRYLAKKVAAIPGDALEGRSRLGWNFAPLAFDSLGFLMPSYVRQIVSNKETCQQDFFIICVKLDPKDVIEENFPPLHMIVRLQRFLVPLSCLWLLDAVGSHACFPDREFSRNWQSRSTTALSSLQPPPIQTILRNNFQLNLPHRAIGTSGRGKVGKRKIELWSP